MAGERLVWSSVLPDLELGYFAHLPSATMPGSIGLMAVKGVGVHGEYRECLADLLLTPDDAEAIAAALISAAVSARNA